MAIAPSVALFAGKRHLTACTMMNLLLRFWVRMDHGLNLNPSSFALNAVDLHPLRPGHALIVPKTHCSRVSELPAEFAAAVGAAVSKVAHAMTEGTHVHSV